MRTKDRPTTKAGDAKARADAKSKKPIVSPPATGEQGPRKVRPPKRHIWRRQDKRFRARPKLPNVFKLTKETARLLVSNRKVVAGIVAVYGLLTIILVRGLNGGANVSELKNELNTVFHGAYGQLAAGVTVFGQLLSSSNSSATNTAGAYQSIIVLMCSLALIWTFRQRLAGVKVRVRDGFYSGMYPLVPVVLVLLVIGLQLLPMLLGTWAYGVVTTPGILVNGFQQSVAVVLLVLLCMTSVYLVCSSIFALYIVTLPNMTPLKALRSARELVRYRRWTIIRKLLFLPLVLLVVALIVMLPCIALFAVAAQWVFFVLSMFALAAVHGYLYTLYRELIRE